MTAAAAVLRFTPSAVSQQIAHLADEVGAPLLERQGRNVHLTPAARLLLQRTQHLNAAWEATKAEVSSSSTKPTGHIRFCGVSSAIAALIAPVISRLKLTQSQIRASVIEEETSDCYKLLTLGEADIAVVLPTQDSPAHSDPRFEQHTLVVDEQDVLVPKGHALASRESIDLTELASESWIAKRRDNDTYSLLSAACAAAGFTPQVVHEAKEWYAISALVSAGLGLCLLPRLVPIPAEHHVVRVPLRGAIRPTRRFLTSTRRGRCHHPLIKLGLEALAELAETGPLTPQPHGRSSVSSG